MNTDEIFGFKQIQQVDLELIFIINIFKVCSLDLLIFARLLYL